MAQQKKIYLGEAEIGLSELKTQMQEIQKIFSNLKLNESASKGLGKEISVIDTKIEKMSQKIKEGFSSTKETDSIKNEISSISKLIDDFIKDTKTNIKFEDIIGIDNETLSRIRDLEKELENLQKKQKDLLNPTAIRAQIGGKSSKDMGFNTGDFTKNLADNILDTDALNKAFRDKIREFQSQLINTTELDAIAGSENWGKNALKNYQKLLKATGMPKGSSKEEVVASYNEQREAIQKNNIELEKNITNLKQWNNEVVKTSNEISIEFNQAQQSIDRTNQELNEIKNTQINNVTNQLRQMGVSAETLTKVMTELGVATDKAGKGLQEATERQKFFDNLNDKIKNVFSAASAFYGLQRAIRFSIDTVQELDAAFTEIAVVTEKTTSQLWESFDTYNKMAQELGVTTVDAIQTSALYYQQGLDTAEVMTLTEETIKMARIAGMDFAEATDRMTAALRGFKLEMSEASRVNDVFSALAAESAVDTDELSSALTRTASISESAGMSLETTSAFLSQMIETTREAPENLGTAMKTIVARFQELKKNLDEVEVDGEIVDANKVETALRSVGVALRDEVTGQFRDLDDVFLELSSIWDTLDRNTQRYIATIAAGSRQQSRFIAMMDNYERTVELVDISQNSSGASAEQFNKTLDSMQSRLNQVRSSLEELVGTLVKSDWVKNIISALNNIIQFFNSIADAGPVVTVLFTVTFAKLIKTLVTNVATGFQQIDKNARELRSKITNTFKSAIQAKIQISYVNEKGQPTDPEVERARLEGKTISGTSAQTSNIEPSGAISTSSGTKRKITNWLNEIYRDPAKNAIATGVLSGISLVAQGSAMTGSQEQALGSMIGSGLGQAIGTGIGGPLGGAIGSAAGAIVGKIGGSIVEATTYGVNHTKKALDKLREDAQRDIDIAKESAEEQDKISELLNTYEELSKQTSLTVEDKEKLLEVNKEIVKIFPDLNGQLSNEATQLQKNINLINNYNKAKKEQAKEEEYQSVYSTAKSDIANYEAEFQKDAEINKEASKGSNAVMYIYDENKRRAEAGGASQRESLGYYTNLYAYDYESFVSESENILNGLKKEIEDQDRIYKETQGAAGQLAEEGRKDANEAMKAIITEFAKEAAKTSDYSELKKIVEYVESDESGFNTLFNVDEVTENANELLNKIKEYKNEQFSFIDDMYSDFLTEIPEKDSEYISQYSQLISNLTRQNPEIIKALEDEELNKAMELTEEQFKNFYSTLNQLTDEEKEKFSGHLNTLFTIDKNDENAVNNWINGLSSIIGKSSAELFRGIEKTDYFDSIKKQFGALYTDVQGLVTKYSSKGTDILSIITGYNPDSFQSYSESVEAFARTIGKSLDDQDVVDFASALRKQLEQTSYTTEEATQNLQTYGKTITDLREMEEASIQGTLTGEQKASLQPDFNLDEGYFQVTANGYKLVNTSIQELIASKNKELLITQQLQIADMERMLNSKYYYEDENGNLVQANQTYQQLFDEVENGKLSYNSLSDSMKEAYNQAVGLKDGIKAAADASQELANYMTQNVNAPFMADLKELDSTINSLKTGVNVLKEWNENQTLSLDSAISLIEANEEYANAISVVNGKLTLNTDIIKQITQAKLDDYRNSVITEKWQLQAALEQGQILENQLQQRLNILDTQITAETNAAEAKRLLDNNQANAEAELYTSMIKNEEILRQRQSDLGQTAENNRLDQLRERFGVEAELISAAQNNWLKYWNTVTEGDKELASKTNIEEIKNSVSAIFSPTTAPIDWSLVDKDKTISDAQMEQLKNYRNEMQKALDFVQESNKNLQKQISQKNQILSITQFGALFEDAKASGKTTEEAQKDIEDYIKKIDRFRNLLQDINNLEVEKEDLEFTIETSSNVDEVSQSILDLQQNLVNLEAKYKEASDVYNREADRVLKELLTDYGDYVHEQNGQLILDDIEIIGLEEEKAEKLTELVETYDEYTDSAEEYHKKELEVAKEQNELYQQQLENITTFQDKVFQLMIERDRKEIEQVKKRYDLIKKEDDKYLDSVRKNIEKERKMRDKEESYDNLAEMQNRLNLLKRDTSGVYRLEILELEEQIEEERQNLHDQEVDDLVSNLGEQTDYRHAAMDDELAYMEAVQERKEETMTEYIEEYSNLIMQGEQALLEFMMATDEEYARSTEEKQKLMRSEWIQTQNKALAASDAIRGGLDKISDPTVSTSIVTSYDKIQGAVDRLTAAYNKQKAAAEAAASASIRASQASMNEDKQRVNDLEFTAAKNRMLDALSEFNSGAENYDEVGAAYRNLASIANTQNKKGNNVIPTAGYAPVSFSANGVKGRTKGADGLWYLDMGTDATGRHYYYKEKDFSKKNGRYEQNKGITAFTYMMYAKGGMVDYTGPAWVDGTPTKPEAFLSASDTENIAKLRDVLSNVFSPTSNLSNDNIVQNSGDIYYEFHINVDGIDSEERIDETIEKIKKEIMDASRGRNVVNIKRGR